MDDKTQSSSSDSPADPGDAYQRPDVTDLGTVADLTAKQVGGADGTTFLGVDLS